MEPDNANAGTEQDVHVAISGNDILNAPECFRRKVKALRHVVAILLRAVVSENSPEHHPSAVNHIEMQESIAIRHRDDFEAFNAQTTFQTTTRKMSQIEVAVTSGCNELTVRLSDVLNKWLKFLELQYGLLQSHQVDGGIELYSGFNANLNGIRASVEAIYISTKQLIGVAKEPLDD